MKVSREIAMSIAGFCNPSTLAALSSTSKLFYSLATPLLYKHISLSTPKQWSLYDRSMPTWITLFTRKAVKEGKTEMWEVKTLALSLPSGSSAFEHLHLPDLAYLPENSILSSLTSLSMRNIPLPSAFIAALLDPRRPARRTLKRVELRCFPPVLPSEDTLAKRRGSPPVALAIVLQMLEFLPMVFYVRDEHETTAEKKAWKMQDKQYEREFERPLTAEEEAAYEAAEAAARQYERPDGSSTLTTKALNPLTASFLPKPESSPSSFISSITATYSSIDSEDAQSSFPSSNPDHFLCHRASPEQSSDNAPPAPIESHSRFHGERTALLLSRLATAAPATALSIYEQLFLPPGPRLCTPCLGLPTSLLAIPPYSSPFFALTTLDWTLSFDKSKDEDLLILFGTDVVSGMKELKLPGRIKELTREIDLMLRSSVALSDPPGVLIPPLPSTFPAPSTSSSTSPAGPAPVSSQPPPFRPLWQAPLTAAERDGEALMKGYRGRS
ncbi:hypothetical protein JCM8547_005955 [Rhodosporidiobolus lusitaniae]